ncbi:hypothetical protein D7316_01904 [Gordonia insulae]|uniref:Integral membrane bound transporter domain-containing protein n=2 Tax=Gordonia insulae TaxID=2420509 RepID=A0A3G8JK40_9ACTN|nr:hypothetical protein D7316_01904 [Gordonia insulae]
MADRVRDRQSALSMVLRPTVWRSSLVLDMNRASVAAPIRVGIAVGLVLVVGGLTGTRDIAGFAALGALISAFCRPDPYRVRLGRLVVLGVGIISSVAVGAILGISGAAPGVEIVTIAVLGSLAALVIGMLHIAGPGAVVFVFAATAAMGFAHDPGDLTRALVATVLGTLCGAVASLAPWLFGGLVGGLRSLIRRVSTPPAAVNTSVDHVSLRTALHRRPRPDLVANSCRILVAMVASAALAEAIGLSHPMWAAMGAMAAMQGVAYHVTVQRGLQRMLGNVVGAVIAAGLLGLGLGYWGAVVAIVICQVVAEISAPVNYAIASSAVTPMALMMTALGAGLTPAAAIDRVADTLIGVVAGIVIAAVTITGGELRAQRTAAVTVTANGGAARG